MPSDTEPTVKLSSKAVALRINKKQYAEPRLNYFGKITEVTASGSGEKREVSPPDPSQGPKKKRP